MRLMTRDLVTSYCLRTDCIPTRTYFLVILAPTETPSRFAPPTARYGPGVEPIEIAIVGAVLLVFTAVSRRFESSPITMPIVFVGAGAALSATGAVEVASELEAVGLLAEITLAVILFSDAYPPLPPPSPPERGLPRPPAEHRSAAGLFRDLLVALGAFEFLGQKALGHDP